jgi:hypothetical protein
MCVCESTRRAWLRYRVNVPGMQIDIPENMAPLERSRMRVRRIGIPSAALSYGENQINLQCQKLQVVPDPTSNRRPNTKAKSSEAT